MKPYISAKMMSELCGLAQNEIQSAFTTLSWYKYCINFPGLAHFSSKPFNTSECVSTDVSGASPLEITARDDLERIKVIPNPRSCAGGDRRPLVFRLQ